MRFNLENWKNLKSWRPYFLILLLAFLLYGRTLFFDFTYFDDSTLILDRAAVLKDLRNIPQIFVTDAFFSGDKFYYRPFLNLSFMIDAQAAGELASIYHLDNVLLHIIAGWLVFALFKRLAGRRDLAFFLSALFLVHPALSQAVAWIPGRNDSLLAIFILAGFLVFLKFLEKPRLSGYIAFLFFYFCALLVKENAIALPALVVFYFLFITPGNLLKSDKWLLVAGSGAVSAVWLMMRSYALGAQSTGLVSAFIGIIHNISALVLQVGKAVLPFNLSVLPILEDSTLIFGFAALAILTAAWFYSKGKRIGLGLFGLVWFLLFLLPSFIRLNTQPDFIEHRLYLPIVGLMIFLAELDIVKKIDFRRRRYLSLAAAVVALFFLLTMIHIPAFSNRLSFWQVAADTSPHSPLAQKNLGVMYYFEGNLEKAKKYYDQALELNPEEPMVHNNIGVIYLARKDYVRAETEFEAELKINPGYDKAIENQQAVRSLLSAPKVR